MMALFGVVVFGFAALERAGVSLWGWEWLPVAVLSAAVAGASVNGLRHLMDEDATPTRHADILIVVLAVASTTAVSGIQQLI
jgi:prepilin signal peptidase PulO-like enzyme (type II secretory pathway)